MNRVEWFVWTNIYKDLTEGHPFGGPVYMHKNYSGLWKICSSPSYVRLLLFGVFSHCDMNLFLLQLFLLSTFAANNQSSAIAIWKKNYLKFFAKPLYIDTDDMVSPLPLLCCIVSWKSQMKAAGLSWTYGSSILYSNHKRVRSLSGMGPKYI